MRTGGLDSPRNLLILTCVGGICALGAFPGLSLAHGAHSRLLITLFFILFLIGLAGAYWGPFQLRKGVRADRWPVEEIDAMRSITQHRAVRFVLLAVVPLLLLSIFSYKMRHLLFWPLFVFVQVISQLQGAFALPSTEAGRKAIDWSEVAPIRSDHWGER